MKRIATFALVITIIMTGSALQAQEEFAHYYLKLSGSDSTEFEYEIGIVQIEDDYSPTLKDLENIRTPQELVSELNCEIDQEGTSDKFNVIIHGIWGHYTLAWNEMAHNLSEYVYANKDGQKKVMLSIIWDSSLNYKTGIEIARRKGDQLAPFFKELLSSVNGKVETTFLCHSMGNRIFQHIVTSSDMMNQDKILIDHYIAAGADLEANIFEPGQPLNGIDKIINDITIYVHNNDRSLKLSKLINKNRRLGLNGIPDLYTSPENFRIIDVSVITDHTKFSSSLSNHRYFYISPTVMKDIKRIIWSKDFITNKRKLQHVRRLKLLPGTEN